MSKKHNFELTGLQLSATIQLLNAVRNHFVENLEAEPECRMNLQNVSLALSKKEFNALKEAIYLIRGY